MPGQHHHQTTRDRAIVALLTEPTLEKASAKAGISLRTIKRWLKDPAFEEKYLEVKDHLLSHATSRLTMATGTVVDVLIEIAKDKKATHSARVSACRVVLETALRGQEVDRFSKQLHELEQQTAEEGDGSNIKP
jgi:hypothetical protein